MYLTVAASVLAQSTLGGWSRPLGPALVDLSDFSRTGIQVAPQWSATVHGLRGTTKLMSVYDGEMYYDSINQRSKQALVTPFTLFSDHDVLHSETLAKNQSGLNINMTLGQGTDTVCKAMQEPYSDMFQWTQYAQRNGTLVVHGQTCDVWALAVKTSTLSTCLRADGVPLLYNQTVPGTLQQMSIEFSNHTVGPAPESVFAPSDACGHHYPTTPCAAKGKATLDVYRIHDAAEPRELHGRNVGDSLGDMAFVCTQGAAESYGDSLVSYWQMDVDTAFGQYGYCLYIEGQNKCYGGTGKQVGRESAMGIDGGDKLGQCSNNSRVGSWLSIPTEGECKDGQEVGQNCSWGNAKRIRTVNASCILHDRGLLDMCKKEIGHAPFLKSAEIFAKALASDDPTKGGCPDVGHAESVLV